MIVETVVDKLIEKKLAKNVFHASNMLNVLECFLLKTDDERIARCELYHAWKMAGENKVEARRKAIAGESVPVKDMFEVA